MVFLGGIKAEKIKHFWLLHKLSSLTLFLSCGAFTLDRAMLHTPTLTPLGNICNRPLCLSISFKLKTAAALYAEMFQQLHCMTQLNGTAAVGQFIYWLPLSALGETSVNHGIFLSFEKF